MRYLSDWSSGLVLIVSLAFPAVGQEKVTDAAARPAPAEKLTDASPSKKTGEYFEFKGGSLKEFLDEIAAYYGVDLRKIGTIPEGMLYTTQVPKMRMKRQGDDFTVVLNLYNSISEEGARNLGKWIIKQRVTPDNRVSTYDRLNALVLIQTEGWSPNAPFAVKAFPLNSAAQDLNGITRDELVKLKQVVEMEWDQLRASLGERPHPEVTGAGSWGRLN